MPPSSVAFFVQITQTELSKSYLHVLQLQCLRLLDNHRQAVYKVASYIDEQRLPAFLLTRLYEL